MSDQLPAAASADDSKSLPPVDEAQIQRILRELRGEQNLMLGGLAGGIGALLGAGIWATVTVVTHFQIGWMAVGVGFLVGVMVRKFGKGVDKVFGIVGAIEALIGCVLGNFLAVCGMIAFQNKIGMIDVLTNIDPATAGKIMVAGFSPIDLLFYGIAISEGYKLSFRALSEGDVEARLAGR